MNKQKIYTEYRRFTKRKAAKYAPGIFRAIQSQVEYYVTTRDLANLPTQQLTATLQQLYRECAAWGVETYLNIFKDVGMKPPVNQPLQIKRRGSIGLNEQFVADILEFFGIDGFNSITQITSTTRNFIRETVAAGIEQQLSLDEIINNLLTSGITKNRAAMISRTETGKAANSAAEIGAKRTGLVTTKTWLSVRDNRTRRDHIQADNQTQPSDQPFIVGNERFLMMHPMDTVSEDGRKIPGKEIINCRCTFGHEAVRGADGLPLRRTANRGGALIPILQI